MSKKQIVFLTENEWQTFIAGVTSCRDRALFTVMYWRGLRASEPRMIRRCDIDLQAGRITFNRLKNSTGGQHDLSPAEFQALSAWLADPKCPSFHEAHNEAHIFDIGRAQIFNLFKKYARAARLPADKQHPHVLKHSIATHLLDKGLDIVDVQDWLGHRQISNTMIYAQVTSTRRRAAAVKAFSGENG